MTKTMKFELPLPPPLNSVYKMGKGRYYKDQKARDWEEEVGYTLKQEKPLKGPLSVDITMFLKVDRDIDSSLKLVLDVMATVGVYENDKQIEYLTVSKTRDKSKPRLEVAVSQI